MRHPSGGKTRGPPQDSPLRDGRIKCTSVPSRAESVPLPPHALGARGPRITQQHSAASLCRGGGPSPPHPPQGGHRAPLEPPPRAPGRVIGPGVPPRKECRRAIPPRSALQDRASPLLARVHARADHASDHARPPVRAPVRVTLHSVRQRVAPPPFPPSQRHAFRSAAPRGQTHARPRGRGVAPPTPPAR
jgi:hypothetical protein